MSDKYVFMCPHCGGRIQVIGVEVISEENPERGKPEAGRLQFKEGETVNLTGFVQNFWEKSGVSQSGFSWKLKTVVLKDENGNVIDVKLWNKMADVDLKVAQKIKLTSFKVEKYEGKLFLRSDKDSKVEVLG